MTTRRPIVTSLALGSLLVLFATTAESQALRYVDEAGVAHWVSSKEQIPQKYRDKVEQLDLPPANSAAPRVDPSAPTREEKQAERQRRNPENAEAQGEKPAPPPAPWGR